MVNQYFDKRKAIAMALATAWSGPSVAVFPPLLLIIFDNYGFMGAFIIIAAISLHTFVSAALFFNLPSSKLSSATTTEDREMKTVKPASLKKLCPTAKSIEQPKTKFIDFTLFRLPEFVCLCFMLFSMASSLALESGFQPALAIQAGISKPNVSNSIKPYVNLEG